MIIPIQYYKRVISSLVITVTKILKQDRAKIGPFFDFLLHYSIFLLEIFNIVVKLCQKFQVKILNNVEENRRKDQSWFYLDWSFLA